MKVKNTFHNYLSAAQYKNLATVFKDLSHAISGDWILTGSVSYGFFLNINYPTELRDVDIVLKASDGADPKSIVLPAVKQNFFVLFIEEAVLGYYFGLRHKETGLWVDLFTPVHQPEFQEFDFEDLKIKVQTPEESFYTIVKALLWRKDNKLMVAEKWLQNAKLLSKNINKQKSYELLLVNMKEYVHLLPKNIAKTPEAIMNYALNSTTQSGYKASSSDYPKNAIVTENGISIERKEEWLKAI